MKILPVSSPEFKTYGKILEGYDTDELLSAMMTIDLPESGTCYSPSIGILEDCKVFSQFGARAYGGMPVQIGMCWGRNTKLNCLEYHRDSEVNIGTSDFVLLLARQDEIDSGMLDTSRVKAFRVPAGIAVEIYATTLHYAPCHTDFGTGFRVAVVLPKGTNTERPDFMPCCEEDRWMTARNKWLLAHPLSNEANNGAHIGLCGVNIDIEN